MMPADLQHRAEYLSLALFSQRVVAALMEYVDENRTVKLRPSLEEALSSLCRVQKSNRPAVETKAAAFGSYEHIRTLEEVWSQDERKEAIRTIRAVLRGASRDPRTKARAEILISQFSKLQNQALWNFEQPKPVSTKVMSRLCQLA